MDVTVDVELDDFDFDEVIEYVEDQGYEVISNKSGKKVSNEDGGATAKALSILCQDVASDKRHFYRELLTDILFLPSNSDDETILEGVKKLLHT